MKISLITLHRITNFGSLLQTYATQTFIEKLGHSVEVVDFVPEGITFKRAVFPKNNNSILKKLIRLIPLLLVNGIQFRMVDRFMKKYIHVTKQRYYSFEELLQDVPEADIYISGSDQVWNTQNNNPAEDIKAYYLCFAPNNKKKVAYAGSFGRTKFDEMEAKQIAEWLNCYDAISVREDTALKTLEDLGINKGVHVVDPTLLLEKEEWLSFCRLKPPKYKYVFVYNLNRNKTLEKLARKIAKKKGLKIVNFADTLEFIFGAKNKMFNTPLDFLNYIAHADFVVTDSFHGTAFSLNFERQFVSLPAPKYNSRLESILRKTNLINERFVKTVEEGLLASERTIDYATVNQILDNERKKSKEYLKEAFKEDDER